MAKILLRDCGRLASVSGYSTANRAVAYYLDQQGHDVYFNAGDPDVLAKSAVVEDKYRDTLVRIAKKKYEPDTDFINITMSPPYSFRRLPGINVGYTMTERPTTKPYWKKFDWVGLCNSMDLLYTPSKWNKEVFKKDGVQKVRQLPWGVSSELFVPPPKRENHGNYKFLMIVDGMTDQSRDEWQTVIRSYNKLFHSVVDVEFTIINRKCDEESKLKYGQHKPTLRVIDGNMRAEELMREYYWTHDCFIKYSREGWGLPVLEAMACGMLVIHNGSTGQTEYLTGENALVFPGGTFGPDGMSLVDEGGTAKMEKWMLHAYQGKGTACKEAGRKTAESLDWSKFACNFIKDIDEQRRALEQKVVA